MVSLRSFPHHSCVFTRVRRQLGHQSGIAPLSGDRSSWRKLREHRRKLLITDVQSVMTILSTAMWTFAATLLHTQSGQQWKGKNRRPPGGPTKEPNGALVPSASIDIIPPRQHGLLSHAAPCRVHIVHILESHLFSTVVSSSATVLDRRSRSAHMKRHVFFRTSVNVDPQVRRDDILRASRPCEKACISLR